MKKERKYNSVELNEARVALLLEDFFEGSTSVEDEEKLYRYFRSDDVSPLFANYISLFRGLYEVNESKRGGKVNVFGKIGWWSISVAAMLAIVVTLGRGLIAENDLMSDAFALYDGSYVIEGGKKITDLSLIMQKLHRAEASSESMMPVSQMNVPTNGLDDEMRQTISEILNY